ncbi:superoxide dismutase family protein [Burkholderia ubonensis]|uniref:superoxide dismutase family protein n=1 Tax=Burkholderia ubonensis TaxID=101571 RepID=UPI000B4E38DA|nr:superoxide dismutase family protein [Burkholderia ubonensis]
MKAISVMILMFATGALIAREAAAAQLSVPMYEVNTDGIGQQVGTVLVRESPYGLLFQAQMEKLVAGTHGFHVHKGASCEPSIVNGNVVPAGVAGGHWDPEDTNKHAGPYGNGHRGDLPPVHADMDGKVGDLVLAPRIHTLDDIRGRTLMVHAGGDNFDDHPMPLGGGGARIVCGVILGGA